MKLGILTDIHEDFKSLEKAIKTLESKHCNEIACLGDIAGFGSNHYMYSNNKSASYCIKLVRENCRYVVKGNHDLFALKSIPEEKAGVEYPDNWYDFSAEKRIALGENKLWPYNDELPNDLTQDDEEYLSKLPEELVIEIGQYRILLSHFFYPDCSGSTVIHPNSILKLKPYLKHLEQENCNFGFVGHGHFGGLYWVRRRWVKNVSFGDYHIDSSFRAAGCPAIASGQQPQGIVIVDLDSNIIEAIGI